MAADDWSKGFGTNVHEFPIRPLPARLPDPASIPPRPWLYGTYLLRGFVSVLVAAGGVGKSMLAMSCAASCALGKPLIGHHVHARVNAWIFNLEDPLDELDRRLAALMLHHNIDRADLDQTLFLNSGRDRRLCIGKVDADGTTILYPDKAAIISACKDFEIGVIVVDPFIKSHELDENRNGDMDAAVTAWAEIASDARCGVLLVHHVRKGPIVDIEAARGGKSLIDGARVGLTMQAMTEEEAGALGVSSEDRARYIRLDDGKANLAPKATKASWFEIVHVKLGNHSQDYPNGDTVATIAAWEPPSPFDDLTVFDCNVALDKISAGMPDGQLYAPSRRGRGNTRWAGNVLMNEFDLDDKQAARVVDSWLKNGVLTVKEFSHNGHTMKGVLVVSGKRPGTEHGG